MSTYVAKSCSLVLGFKDFDRSVDRRLQISKELVPEALDRPCSYLPSIKYSYTTTTWLLLLVVGPLRQPPWLAARLSQVLVVPWPS